MLQSILRFLLFRRVPRCYQCGKPLDLGSPLIVAGKFCNEACEQAKMEELSW
jgi:hypothetical protein